MTALLDEKMLKVDPLARVSQMSLYFSVFLSSLLTLFFSSSSSSAARGHDISVGGGGGRRVSPLDMVQVSLLPEALCPHPADVAGGAETGCEVRPRHCCQ